MLNSSSSLIRGQSSICSYQRILPQTSASQALEIHLATQKNSQLWIIPRPTESAQQIRSNCCTSTQAARSQLTHTHSSLCGITTIGLQQQKRQSPEYRVQINITVQIPAARARDHHAIFCSCQEQQQIILVHHQETTKNHQIITSKSQHLNMIK